MDPYAAAYGPSAGPSGYYAQQAGAGRWAAEGYYGATPKGPRDSWASRRDRERDRRDDRVNQSGRDDTSAKRRSRSPSRDSSGAREGDRRRDGSATRRRASPPPRAPTSPRRRPPASSTTTSTSTPVSGPDPDARTKARRAASRSATAKDIFSDSLNYADMEDSADATRRPPPSPPSRTSFTPRRPRSASRSPPRHPRQPPTGPRADRRDGAPPTGPAASRANRASRSPELDRRNSRANGDESRDRGWKRSRTPSDRGTGSQSGGKASLSPEAVKRIKRRDSGETKPAPRQILEVASNNPGVPAVMTTLASSPVLGPSEDEGDEDEDATPVTPAQPQRALPTELYTRIAQVGEGTYGQVFKARSETTGVLVALKKIRMESEKDGFPITAMREIKLLQMLRHPNVVRLHEMMTTMSTSASGRPGAGAVYMVFEYMEHDLNGVLHHPSVQFSAAHLKSLAKQLLEGLDYLHDKAVLHRDLKGSNILLNNAGLLKLADFGLARLYAKRRTDADYTNRVVTLWYRPPELLLGTTRYGTEVDCWGAGCIFLELFTRKAIFQGQDEIHQVQAIVDVLGPMSGARWEGAEQLPWFELIRPTVPALGEPDADGGAVDVWSQRFRKNYAHLLSPPALDVAEALLHYDPRKRASAAQALAMPYFTEEAPKPKLPADALSKLKGEWHELESRRARQKSGRAAAAAELAAGAGVKRAAEGTA
ncbi:Pkinase-domain-containing protein [Jaminaea rosea]|uniref:cyclin-dependent kinase n=1 Tax=Jaminaea rosea TaxID=1569628 RepID=A0A316UI47_9BASI|nr:Pkinase-domain-containing protein [Jaminaea rosea]PWN24966.1 Pkinase-domain-containing protein [Jaminaea rosea]